MPSSHPLLEEDEQSNIGSVRLAHSSSDKEQVALSSELSLNSEDESFF